MSTTSNEISNEIFYGCRMGYEDGTLPLISKGRPCRAPTSIPFWKNPEDVNNWVKTRQQLKQTSLATFKYINDYFNADFCNHRKRR